MTSFSACWGNKTGSLGREKDARPPPSDGDSLAGVRPHGVGFSHSQAPCFERNVRGVLRVKYSRVFGQCHTFEVIGVDLGKQGLRAGC